MARYVAFLRAINLGSTRKFPKSEIVAATEAAGMSGVATYINTGNVCFETALRSRHRIETALEHAYRAQAGFEVPTIVFSTAELREVLADAEEVGADFGGVRYVSLLKDEPEATLAAAFEARSDERDSVHVRGRGAHLLLADPYHSARLTNAQVEKGLGVATNRNLTVIRAIVERWC